MSDALITKHRPINFDTVIGQDHIMKSLQNTLEKKTASTFVFSGPAGTGKTTLARISAGFLECDPRNILEVDAATFSGIDKTRELKEVVRYPGIGQAGTGRAVILDECHRLSAQAWDSLLKEIEEPSPNLFWFFCTTNLKKVPKTVQTRGASYVLKAVGDVGIRKVLARVIKKEGMDVPEGVLDIVCRQSGGSPRQALSNLAICETARTAKEAAALLQTALDTDATIELCRFMVSGGGSWPKCMGIVKKLEDENPEGVRIVVMNYFASVVKGATSDKAASAGLHILDCFSTEYNSNEGFAPLLLSIGRAMNNGE